MDIARHSWAPPRAAAGSTAPINPPPTHPPPNATPYNPPCPQDRGVDGHPTVFTRNMGTMEVLPVLGKHLNVRVERGQGGVQGPPLADNAREAMA